MHSSDQPIVDGARERKEPNGSVPRGCLILFAITVVPLGALAVVAHLASASSVAVATVAPVSTPTVPMLMNVSTVNEPSGPVVVSAGDWGNRCWRHMHPPADFVTARLECERGLAMNPMTPYPRANLLYNMGLIETHDGNRAAAEHDLRLSFMIRPMNDVAGRNAVRQALGALGVRE